MDPGTPDAVEQRVLLADKFNFVLDQALVMVKAAHDMGSSHEITNSKLKNTLGHINGILSKMTVLKAAE